MRKKTGLLIVLSLVLISISYYLILINHVFERGKVYHPSIGKHTKITAGRRDEINLQRLQALPIIEVPAKKPGDTLVVLFSGDGGWGNTEIPLSQDLAEAGVAVVGFNSPLYFNKEHPPIKIATDAENIISYYTTIWNKSKVILMGYSFGADIVPFVYAHLSPDTRQKITNLTLLAPTDTIEFFIGNNFRSYPAYSVLNEVKKIKDVQLVCFHGTLEIDSLCNHTNQKNIVKLSHQGGHLIRTNYQSLLNFLLKP